MKHALLAINNVGGGEQELELLNEGILIWRARLSPALLQARPGVDKDICKGMVCGRRMKQSAYLPSAQ